MQRTEEYYSSASSEPVPGAARSPLEEVSSEELMAFPPSPARPRWMRTRYPVEMDEFRRLVEEAQRPGPTGPEAIMDPTADDEDAQAAEALALLDPPEGEAIAAPEAAAPALTRSFDGIGQTAWVPADPAITVGASHVLVAVNTDLAGYSKGGALLFRWPNMTTLFATRLIAGPRSHARRLRRRVVA